MSKPMVKIYNMETDEVIEREMNADEYAEHLENLKIIAAREAEAEAKATARASALAKLAALGLSADEIAAL